MTFLYLNLTEKQCVELGNAVVNKTKLDLILDPKQFVNANEVTSHTIKVNLTKVQMDKIKKKNLKLCLSFLQCRKIVEEINKIHGGALPLLALAPLLMKGIAALGAVGSVAGGVSQIVNAVNNKKYQDKLVSETKRHNLSMEQSKGNGLFLAPKSKGTGLFLAPKQKGKGLFLAPQMKSHT